MHHIHGVRASDPCLITVFSLVSSLNELSGAESGFVPGVIPLYLSHRFRGYRKRAVEVPRGETRIPSGPSPVKMFSGLPFQFRSTEGWRKCLPSLFPSLI